MFGQTEKGTNEETEAGLLLPLTWSCAVSRLVRLSLLVTVQQNWQMCASSSILTIH